MPICIAVHGGAGARHPDERPEASAEGCLRAARAGHRVLAAGGSALDAVETAVCLLEDHPLFNAGTGSCLNRDGEVEMDALLMDGQTQRVGAVALVRTVPNPIRLARAVMENTPHAFIAGPAADALAQTLGVPRCEPQALVTERSRARWAELLRGAPPSGHGTVGAVALDARGQVAAATSTGGTVGKWPGRIGDTPLPGAGTYAREGWGAASATGKGELILRALVCREACEQLSRGVPVEVAAAAALQEVSALGGTAGLILVSPQGELSLRFTTERMARAWVDFRGVEGAAFAQV